MGDDGVGPGGVVAARRWTGEVKVNESDMYDDNNIWIPSRERSTREADWVSSKW